MAQLFLVVDQNGAHEPDAVLSIWDSRAGAAAEITRLQATPERWQTLAIVEVDLNAPSDDWLNG